MSVASSTASGRRVPWSDAALIGAVGVIVIAIVMSGLSQTAPGLDERARVIETQLRCPTCQGLSIADSPATAAVQMRGVVRDQLEDGASDDEVRAFFVARYGRWILLDPPGSGLDLALWIAPAVIVIVGSILVVRRARVLKRGAAGPGWSATPPVGVGRAVSAAIAAAMALALALPIAAAVGPRLMGREVTGGPVPLGIPSIRELQATVRAQPGDVEALVSLGDALLGAQRAGEAAEQYRAALALDPDNVPALLGVGAILLAADRPADAGPVFDRILRQSPDQPDALLYRAVARLRMDGAVADEARADLERFLRVAPLEDPRRAMAAGLLAEPASSLPPSSGPPEEP